MLNLILSLGDEAWQEHGRPSHRAQQWVPKKHTALLSVFSEECPVSDSQTWLFPTESVRSVQEGLSACDTFAESPPKKACHLPRYLLGKRGKIQTTAAWVFKRSGGWGLWGGGEARWGLERSRVLYPVGQVELEFRRVGGREAASGKRKKIQAAQGEHWVTRRGEPKRLGCWSAARPRDLEGLPLLARPGASARGRQCPVPVSLLPL